MKVKIHEEERVEGGKLGAVEEVGKKADEEEEKEGKGKE